jgi:hypothetical protein
VIAARGRATSDRLVLQRPRRLAVAALASLALSVVALAVAPAFMPPSYDWIVHTTSESAAQGVPRAWVARLGFVGFGTGVVLLAAAARAWWGRVGALLHATFGIAMVATAAFSVRPWDPALPFDRVEDLLHSVAATGMGFAFAFGILAVSLRRPRGARRWHDVAAIVASVALPLAMMAVPELAGVLQRGMFVVAYAWYGGVAVALLGAASTSVQPPAT